MPKETKAQAQSRAKKSGFKQSAVVKADKGGYFIAPHGVETAVGKKAYANHRAKGNNKAESAKIAHYVDKKAKNK